MLGHFSDPHPTLQDVLQRGLDERASGGACEGLGSGRCSGPPSRSLATLCMAGLLLAGPLRFLVEIRQGSPGRRTNRRACSKHLNPAPRTRGSTAALAKPHLSFPPGRGQV